MKRLCSIVVAVMALLCSPMVRAADEVTSVPGVLAFYPITVCTTPPLGTRAICFDLGTGELVAVDDTGATFSLESGGGGGAHDLLSATHTDTVADVVSQGALVIGNSTPAWELLLPGGDGTFLRCLAAPGACIPGWDVANFTDLVGTATDAQIPDNITITLAATATALAANGGNCGAGNYPLGVDASGAVEGCTAASGGVAATTVESETSLGVVAAVGTDTEYARQDHTHGSASEAIIEAAVDLQDLQGAVVDGQVPDTITIDLAAAATALAANPADCFIATQFAVGVTASGAATCEAIADADVPNTITIDNATTAANGDSATAFFPGGAVEIAVGGTGATTPAAALAALGGPTLIASGAAPAAGAASAVAAPSETWLINTADNAVTTVETVMSVTSVPIGTYYFQYNIVWRSGTTTVGTSFTVDYTGTVTRIRAARRGQTFNALAADGIADGTSAALTGGVVEGWGVVADNTALGPNTGVGSTTEDQFDVIEGIIVVSTSANLNLAMTGEGGGAVTFKADSMLFLKRLQ